MGNQHAYASRDSLSFTYFTGPKVGPPRNISDLETKIFHQPKFEEVLRKMQNLAEDFEVMYREFKYYLNNTRYT